MAGKKGKGRDFDEFDLDNLDDGLLDLDFGDDADNKKRTPVSRIKSGVKMGVQSTFDNPDFRRRFLKGALPKEYSSGIEGTREILSEAQELYNTTSDDVRKTGREVRDFLSRSLPSSRRFIPDRLAKKLNEWLDDEERSHGQQDYERNLEESEISTALGEIFKTQAEEEAKKEETEELKDHRQKAIERRQFKSQQSLLSQIVALQQRQNAYQDNVTIAYQRKHLEMEMRQYNVLRKIHSVLVHDSKNQDRIQRDILHNTALPDFQKIKQNEAFRESIRNRLYGAIAEGPLAGVSTLMRGFAKNVTNNLLNGFRSSLEIIGDAANAASSMADMAPDKYEIGGTVVGGMGTERLARMAGKRIRRFVNRNPNVARRGRQFSRIFGDMERYANTFASGDTSDDYYEPQYDDEGNEIKEGFWQRQFRRGRRALRQNLPSYAPDQTLLVRSRPGSLNDPDLITSRFTRTVEEVIPKLLSMIYGEVRSTRTGRPVSAFHYDFASRRVVNDSQATQELNNRLFSENRRESVNEDIDSVLRQIDPDDTLSASAKRQLRRRIIREARLGRQFSPKEFASNTGWPESANPNDIGEIRSLIQRRFNYHKDKGFGQTLEDEKLRDDVDAQLRRLTTYSPDAKNDVLNMVRAGNLNAAKATGLVDETDQGWFFNEEKYFNYLINGERPNIEDNEGFGGDAMGPRRTGPKGPTRPRGGGPGLNMERHTNRIVQALTKGFNKLSELMHAQVSAKDPGERKENEQFGRIADAGEMANAWLEEISDQIRHIRVYGINLGKLGENIRHGYTVTKEKVGEASAAAKVRARILSRSAKARWLLGSRWASRKAQELQDAYIKGRVGPVLRAELIRGREYYDVNSGKVIEKLSDITGEVRNKAGDVVLTAEEYKDGLLDEHGDKLVAAYINAEDFVRDVVPRVFRSIPGIFREAREQAHNLLDGPEDVYVKGEKKPRLLARIMKEGGYFLKASGKRVRRPKDIDGEVVDKDGNVVLSEEDFEKGLIDKYGDAFEGISGKLSNLFSDVRDRLTEGRYRASALLKTAGAGALNLIGRAIGGLEGFEFPKLLIGGQKEVVRAVDRIYNLIAPQFGGEPIDSVVGGAKKGVSTARKLKDWFQEQSRTLKGESFADKRRLVMARRRAREAGQRFSFPTGLSLTGVRSAWEKTKEIKERAGDREGSWLNIRRKRQKDKEKEVRDKTPGKGKRRGGLMGMIASGIFSGIGLIDSAMFGNLFGGFRTFGKLLWGGLKAIPAIAKGTWWIAKKGLPLAARTLFTLGAAISRNIVAGFKNVAQLLMFSIGGLGRGIWKLTKSIGSGLWKAGGWAARKVKGMPGSLKSVVKKLPGRTARASSWLWNATKTAGRFALTRALPAVAGALMSPVVLGITAVAALAFGGYKLYQYIKSKDAILVRLRMVQYGIDFDDEQQVNKVDRLEQALIKDVRIAKDGSGRIESRLNPKDLLALFDISSEDEEAVRPWTIWFVRRFKPIFLRHVAAMRTIMNRYRISGTQADLLKIDEKLETWQAKYDFAVRVKDEARDDQDQLATEYMESPFPGVELEYDSREAKNEYIRYTFRLKSLREDEIDEQGKHKVDDSGLGDNKWNTTVNEREDLTKRREARMQADQQARAFRTEQERKAKNRLEAAMAAAKASPSMAGESGPLVEKLRDQYQRAVENAAIKSEAANAKGWVWPTVGGRISSMYGRRIDPISGKPAGHGGIDIAAPIGTPIFAAFPGVIIRRAYSQSYGNVIYLKHADGRCSRYAHMDEFEPGLSVGDHVEAGQVLGYMGSTGKSTGSHLHFEIRESDAAYAPTVDPLTVITDPKVQRQAEEVIEEAKLENQGEERDFKDDDTSPMEGKDTIASTLAGKATEPEDSAASEAQMVEDMPRSEVSETLNDVKIERERQARHHRQSQRGDEVERMPDVQRQQLKQRMQQAQRTQQVRQQQALANEQSVSSAAKMTALNEQQVALQKEMRDALNKIVLATASFESLTPEMLETLLSPKKDQGYRPNNPPSNQLGRHAAQAPAPQAAPVLPMR